MSKSIFMETTGIRMATMMWPLLMLSLPIDVILPSPILAIRTGTKDELDCVGFRGFAFCCCSSHFMVGGRRFFQNLQMFFGLGSCVRQLLQIGFHG